MGYGLLEMVTGLLTGAGLRAGEEYPAGERMEILSPAAAVGLEELDPVLGLATVAVRVLSPRLLGGWCCQVWAAQAAQVLCGEGMSCKAGEMEYLSGSDCFCIALTARWPVALQEGEWVPRESRITIGDAEQEGVVSFRALRSLGRRPVGTLGQAAPVSVTPGSGGWELELVQRPSAEPEEVEEPFTLTVLDMDRRVRYTGCCWNETVWDLDREGLLLTRRGFGLTREVETGE